MYNDFFEYAVDVINVSSSGYDDHKALGQNEVVKYRQYIDELTKITGDSFYQEYYEKDVKNHK